MFQTLLERDLWLGSRDAIKDIVRNHASVAVDLIQVPVRDSQFSGFAFDKGRFKPSDMVLVPDVVLIEERHVRAARLVDCKIPSRRLASVRLPKERDRVRLGQVLDDFRSAVVGAVVDHDQLVDRGGLGKDASDRLLENSEPL